MSVTLSPETQALIEEQMRRGGFATADDMVRVALEILSQFDDEQTDDQEVADIREATEQVMRGDVM